MVHEAPTPSHFQAAMVNSFSCSSHLLHTTHITHTNFLDEEISTSNDPRIFWPQTPKSPLNGKQDAHGLNKFMLLLGAVGTLQRAGQFSTFWQIHWACEINRKISMIFPLVSCCSCVNKPSSS